MTTEVSICSNALLRLGADPISSFDEADQSGSNIERARLASNLWPTVRRRVLRAHVWNCAIKRVLLSPDATPPAFGFARRFQRPSDWLRNVAIGNDARDERGNVYRVEGNYLLSDEASLPLLYVWDNNNPDTFDSLLVDALELAMAAALAYPVTKSTSLAAELVQATNVALRDARSIDAQDDPADTLGNFPMLNSRRAGRMGRAR